MIRIKLKFIAKTCTLILLCITLSTTFAQTKEQLTQNIRGVVTDKFSGNPLSDTTIKILETKVETTTDKEGNFILNNIPIGRYDLVIFHKEYEPTTIKEILIGSAKEIFLEITLTEKSTQIEEVILTRKLKKSEPLNKMALLGAQMFSVEEASRFAGGMDDPARLVSSYAGIATPSISNNGISIHGNAPSLLQWRVEGIEIPNPNHFADSNVLGGGLLSGLSSNVVGNSDFFIGAFPAEYGNAISGVFDMNLRNGNNQKYQHTFQLGVLGIDFASEGPISKKHSSSYIVNYRYSTTELLEKIRGKDDMGGTLGYQDLNFKLNFPTKKAGTFSIWSVGLIDKATPIEEDPSDWKYLDDGLLSTVKQKSSAAGVSHKYFFGNHKTSIKTTLAATHLENNIDEEFQNLNGIKSPKTDLTTTITNFIFTSSLDNKFSSRHTNKTGITLTNINYDMNLDFTPIFEQPLENYANSDGRTNLISAFTSSKINLGDNFLLSAGLHAQYLALNKNTTIEPRVNLKWQMNTKNSFALGYGLHSRMEKPDVYFVKDKQGNFPNEELDLTKSHHFMLSYVYRISNNMNLKIEPYFEYLFDIPVTKNGSYSIINRKDFYTTDLLVSEGKGKNYGIDLTFEKYFTQGIYYMINTSLFDSKYRGGDGEWYDTRFNRKFIVNGLIGKEWILGRDILGINLKASVLGGQRYTPVDEVATMAHPDKEVQYDESKMYSKQFSPMFVGDFTISYKMNRKQLAHEFAIKSINATNQKEYVEHKYNIKNKTIEAYRPATSIFNISYRIEF